MASKYLWFLLFMRFAVSAGAQRPDSADYQRAVAFLWGNMVNRSVFNDNVQAIWAQDSSGVAFVSQGKTGRTFYKVSWETQQIEPLFNHDRLTEILADTLNMAMKSTELQLQGLRYRNAELLEFTVNRLTFELDLTTYALRRIMPPANNPFEAISPDGKWVAFTDQYNLFIESTEDGSIRQLSTRGEYLYEYGTSYGWSDIIEGENGERPSRFWARWSPDSRWIQTYVTDMRNAEKMYLLDWSVDTLYKPRLLSYYRGSPGDTTMVRMTPVFYNVETGEEYQKDHLPSTHTNPIQYRWAKTGGIVYQENTIRGYQAVELHRCDLNRRTEDLLYRETSKTNIDNYRSDIIEDWGKALITSERDGWKQLYLLDLKDKSLQPLTNGAYYVNQVVHIDIPGRFLLFTASGKEPGRNPYHQHLYKLTLATGKVELLTPEDANHDVSVSPCGQYFLDNISTLNQPTRTVLKSVKPGDLSLELARADMSRLDSMGYRLPEPFTAVARDGKTTIYGAIWKPSHFDPSRRYPVIDQSYTGPHTFMYPRNFSTALSRSNQAFAELGFIVVTVDGMGTANRSKAFHNVSYKNMGKNLEDHRLAILQLGRRYSWLDTTRVGIFGHSAGGYDAAHALLEYPDFYKVAVASSADHDFRMEKDWWPEMYMGWPVDSTYHLVSNITMAGNLKGKLLITHGGIDENVNPSATFKLAEALVRANKEFDMLIFPSQRHGYQGAVNNYFIKKRWNYFVQHLLGAEPIWEVEMR